MDLFLLILLLISVTANVIQGFALHTCLPRPPLEPKQARTDDGEPWALLNLSDENNAWNKMALAISPVPIDLEIPPSVVRAKPAKPKRGKKGKAELVKA